MQTWMHHAGKSPISPAEAQFQTLLGSFLRRTLKTHDDFSWVPSENISLWETIQWPLTTSIPRCSFPPKKPPPFHCRGISPLLCSLLPHGGPICSIPPTTQTQETRVEMPGTKAAAALIQILHADKASACFLSLLVQKVKPGVLRPIVNPQSPLHHSSPAGGASTQRGEMEFANTRCQWFEEGEK